MYKCSEYGKCNTSVELKINNNKYNPTKNKNNISYNNFINTLKNRQYYFFNTHHEIK